MLQYSKLQFLLYKVNMRVLEQMKCVCPKNVMLLSHFHY